MAINAGKAVVQLVVSGKQQVKKTLDGVQARLKRFGSSIRKMGAAGGRLALIGTAAAIGGFSIALKKAINAASDMQQTMNKFNTVFGESSDEMVKWADEIASSFGRSQEEVRRFAASTQDLLKPMNMAPAMATELSKSLTRLAYDVSSFNGANDGEVLSNFHAALTGSGEVMKNYGVILDEAAVNQELMNQSLDPSKATNNQKVMARYNIILRGTTDAQNDVARSSSSYANQMKALKAKATDMMRVLGDKLLPIIENIMMDLQVAGDVFSSLSTNVDSSTTGFSDMTQIMAWLGSPVKIAMKGFFALSSIFRALQAAVAFAGASLAKFIELLASSHLAKRAFGKTADTVAQTANAIAQDLTKLREEQTRLADENLNLAFTDRLDHEFAMARKSLQKMRDDANREYKEIADFSDPNAGPNKDEEKKKNVANSIQTQQAAAIEATSTKAYEQFIQNQQQESLRVQKKMLALLEKHGIVLGAA